MVRWRRAGYGRRGPRRGASAGEPAARGHDARAPGVQEPAERDRRGRSARTAAARLTSPSSSTTSRRRRPSSRRRESRSTATSTLSTRVCSPAGGGCTSRIRTATPSSSSGRVLQRGRAAGGNRCVSRSARVGGEGDDRAPARTLSAVGCSQSRRNGAGRYQRGSRGELRRMHGRAPARDPASADAPPARVRDRGRPLPGRVGRGHRDPDRDRPHHR